MSRGSWHYAVYPLLALLVSQPIMAQSYPSRPIRVIVPLTPGGSADVGGRPT